MIGRRTFIKGASVMAIAGATSSLSTEESYAQQVSNSSGTQPPKLKAPPNACDCHIHIYDPRFVQPSPRATPANASMSDYRLFQKRIGTSRVVVVTPRNYATDNRCTLDAIAQLGPNARGVGVLHPTVSDAELKMLHDGGVRGTRFSLGDPATAIVKVDMIEPLAKRVANLGWHLQFAIEGEQIVELADLLRRLPTPLVFDHLARPPLPAGINHPSHSIVRGLIDKNRAWVKVSGAYSNSQIGPPTYPEATKIAQAFVKAAPERLVWGSDWPHPGLPEPKDKPDDAVLFDLLTEWAPDQAVRNRILVQNPATLYGFTA